ncbi:hypothetical protein [Paracoccus sp. (in: a-proteobacteria)]|uniref:hypothetical protein n=1 Tax=Paracoccus sp. TaxID=267 RepID=UPI0035AEEE32
MHRPSFILAAFLALSQSALPVPARGRACVEVESGNDNAAINGTITGDEYIDYVLRAKKGQTMAISLRPGETNSDGRSTPTSCCRPAAPAGRSTTARPLG